jgi:hypothetical protein
MTQDIPKSTVPEQLAACFPSDDQLPPSILMVNTSEWQGQVTLSYNLLLSMLQLSNSILATFIYIPVAKVPFNLYYLVTRFKVKRKAVKNYLYEY